MTPGSIKANKINEQKPLTLETPCQVKGIKVEEVSNKKMEETEQNFKSSFQKGLYNFRSHREKRFPSLSHNQQSERQ